MFEIILIFSLILIEGFFSGSEISFLSARKTAVMAGIKKGLKSSRIILEEWKKPERILTTSLTGTTLCIVTASTLGASLVNKYIGSGYEFLAGLILAPFIILFGELIPKEIGFRFADYILKTSIYPLKILSYLFLPITALFSLFEKIFPGKEDTTSSIRIGRKEVFEAIELAHSHGKILDSERMMAEKILNLREFTLEKVKIPLVDLVAIGKDKTVEDLFELFVRCKFSKIPVFSGRIYNIIGYVDVKEVFKKHRNKQEKIGTFLKEILYFPETMPADSALFKLISKGEEMGATVDEFGGVSGIITLLDLIQQLIGPMKKDNNLKSEKLLSSNMLEFDGRTPVEEIEKILKVKFPEEIESVTIGGVLTEILERIPSPGEEVVFMGYRWIITKSDLRRITSVKVEK